MSQRPPRIADLDLVALDFDGVLTDNRVLVSSEGVESVFCSRADGWGLDLLRPTGLKFAIVSTEANAVVSQRAAKLRVPVRQAVADKASAIIELAGELGVELARVAFVGNDTNDLPAMNLVGWPMCPSDSHPLIIAKARWVFTRAGGEGVIRELADLLLSAGNP